MDARKTEGGYLIRFETGEELLESLIDFCKQQGIEAGWLTGLGAARSVELGFYHLDRQEYSWKSFDQPLEIVSMTGNVAVVEEEPFLHIHGVFSTADSLTHGGHVKTLLVGPTCELQLTIFDDRLERTLDAVTGLKLLTCEQNG